MAVADMAKVNQNSRVRRGPPEYSDHVIKLLL